MNRYLVIFLGMDNMNSRKKVWHKGSPKSAIRAMVMSEMDENFKDRMNTAEDIETLKQSVRDIMSSYTKADGGIYVARDEWGIYIATMIS